MKHLKLYTKVGMFGGLIIFSQVTFSQSDYEKRQKAAKLNEEQLNRVYQNNLPNKPLGITGTSPAPVSSGSSIYVTDHQKKIEYYTNKENARLAAWEEKERKFNLLNADVPKTEANYYRLIALAEQAGFENYDAVRMNGRYKPKSVTLPVLLPVQQGQFDNYRKLAKEYSGKKDWNATINAYLEALKISGDLIMRSQLANIYRYHMQDYESAANQYQLIHLSPITEKPLMEHDYMNWGQVSILSGNYEKAIWCFTDLPAHNYDISGASIYQSYACYLAGDYLKAHSTLLNRYTYEYRTDVSNLIKNFYLIRNGSNDAAALFEKIRQKNTTLPYTGDISKDLALLLFNEAKNRFDDTELYVCYFLDMAADLDPTNLDITETRYDYNTDIKRVGFDDGMPSDLLASLAAGKPGRDAKRKEDAIAKEKARNKGYMVLWFGNGKKPLQYRGYPVDMAGRVEQQNVVNDLREQLKNAESLKNVSFLSYTFLKDASEDDVYNEAAKNLKLNLKKAKEYKNGYLFTQLSKYEK